MMKYLIALLLVFICFTNKIHSLESDKGKNYCELQKNTARRYICYKFGLSKIIEIYIAEDGPICDVVIYDDNEICISTSCQKSSLLRWAFDDMTKISTEYPVIKDNVYKPYYYNLSIHTDSTQTILSSSMKFDYSDEIMSKIEELRRFMISLWYFNCVQKTEHSIKSFFDDVEQFLPSPERTTNK